MSDGTPPSCCQQRNPCQEHVDPERTSDLQRSYFVFSIDAASLRASEADTDGTDCWRAEVLRKGQACPGIQVSGQVMLLLNVTGTPQKALARSRRPNSDCDDSRGAPCIKCSSAQGLQYLLAFE
jgi:hypothetical protein